MLTKGEALKRFFSTESKPVTNEELIDLRKNDPEGYDELAEAAREALAGETPQVAAAPVGALV